MEDGKTEGADKKELQLVVEMQSEQQEQKLEQEEQEEQQEEEKEKVLDTVCFAYFAMYV